MPDLSTRYLGFNLKNPLVVSASPLTEDLDNIKRMEDEGAAAIVMHSLFEEQITLQSQELDCHLSHGAESYPESLTYFDGGAAREMLLARLPAALRSQQSDDSAFCLLPIGMLSGPKSILTTLRNRGAHTTSLA